MKPRSDKYLNSILINHYEKVQIHEKTDLIKAKQLLLKLGFQDNEINSIIIEEFKIGIKKLCNEWNNLELVALELQKRKELEGDLLKHIIKKYN